MKNYLRLAVSLLVAAVPLLASAAFDGCLDHFPSKKIPVVDTQGLQARELCFDGFAVLHSGTNKTPIYVVERLNKERLLDAKGEKRTNKFYEEARLPSHERAQLGDYKGSGFDRGHMAPAGDMPTPNAMAQSFSLANMVPQARQHNQRLWNKIEQDTRKYVMRASGDVYVFTGPWYNSPEKTLGGSKVKIPDVIWKLVYDETAGRGWVHWTENRDGETINPPISMAEFTARTGFDMLKTVPISSRERDSQRVNTWRNEKGCVINKQEPNK